MRAVPDMCVQVGKVSVRADIRRLVVQIRQLGRGPAQAVQSGDVTLLVAGCESTPFPTDRAV